MPDRSHRQQSALVEETQRRGRLVLQALPVLSIPIVSGVLAFLLASAAMGSRLPQESHARPSAVVFIIVSAVFFTALITLVRLGRPTVSALLLISGWTLVTMLATLGGGVGSIGPAFLIIPICAAGLLIDGVASMSLAALATVLVTSLSWLEMRGVYTAAGPQLPLLTQTVQPLSLPVFSAIVWSGLFWTVALLTSLLAGGVQRALEQSREQERALRELSNQLEARVAEQTDELAQRAARAEALYEVSQALTSTLDLNTVLGLIAEQATRLLGFDSAQVLLEHDGGFSALRVYGQNGDGDERLAALEPLLQQVAERGEPIVVPAASAGSAGGQKTVAALLLPMCHGAGVAGVLMLANAHGDAHLASDDIVLGQGLADQAAVAIANAQLLTQAREAATIEERTRLARDIHDTLAQGLTGVVVQLGAAQRAFEAAPVESREHLALALRMARESLAEARRSVWNLRAAALERGDLSQALKALTVRPMGAGVSVSFEQRGEPWPLPSAVESTLLRVCQEALSNVSRHAQASEASVILEYRSDSVALSIHDNGIGFNQQPQPDAQSAPGPWGGFGLVGMRERLSTLGGTLQIGDEQGAQITAVIPRLHAAPTFTAAAYPSESQPEETT
jgi:signal transduction histidine kinase